MEFHNDNIESEIGYAFDHLVYKRFLGLEPISKMIEHGDLKIVNGQTLIIEFARVQLNIINLKNEIIITLVELPIIKPPIFKFKILLRNTLKNFWKFDINDIKENQIKYYILDDNDRNKLKELLKTIDEYEL